MVVWNTWGPSCRCFKRSKYQQITLPETKPASKTPENGWLEYDPFLLAWHIFRCELLVSGRVSSKKHSQEACYTFDIATRLWKFFFLASLGIFLPNIHPETSRNTLCTSGSTAKDLGLRCTDSTKCHQCSDAGGGGYEKFWDWSWSTYKEVFFYALV